MKILSRVLVGALCGVGATMAQAAPVDVGMTVQGRVGYGSNPFLADDDNPGALLVGIRLSPHIATRTETSSSSLSGFYDYTHYTRRYTHSDTLGITAQHQQRLSPTLSTNLAASYVNSLNSLFGPFDTIDEVAIGRRQRVLSGNIGFDYQPNARDTWSIGGFGSHAFYPRSDTLLSGYTTYGTNLAYSRALSDSTSIGASFGVSVYDSRSFADTTSYHPSLTLRHRFAGAWVFDGHVGAILERSRFAGARFNSTSLGFGARLCHEGARATACFDADRDTAPSGLGGLRTETRGGASIDYRLSERTTLAASARYGRSRVGGFAAGLDQDYAIAHGEYRRRLTQRLSVGASLDYRLQKYERAGTRHAVAGALNVIAQIGRTK